MNNKQIEIVKSLFNSQRANILQIIKDEPKTVKDIAKEMNEKVSRLYYHINKLEELGLIEVTEEKQVGNLLKKYYKKTKIASPDEYTFVGNEAYENSDFLINQLYTFTNEAINRIKIDLENQNATSQKVNSEASVLQTELTYEEWKEVNKKVREIISNRNASNNKDTSVVNYLVMSYINEK